MPLQHYLPATYLVEFSSDKGYPKRDRFLSVGDLIDRKVFRARAKNVAAINNLYTLVEWSERGDIPTDMLEKLWAKYETRLNSAIDDLIKGFLDGETWLRVLVPFVACMFIRGKDFNKRFEKRISINLKEFLVGDAINMARLMELQRILAPVISALWVVLKARDGEFITNDYGYVPNVREQGGIGIPLDKRNILVLYPQKSRQILYEMGGRWFPFIDQAPLLPGVVPEINQLIANAAMRFIFGSENQNMDEFLKCDFKQMESPEPHELGLYLPPADSRIHELTWHKLISVVAKKPSEVESWDFRGINGEEISKGWKPPIIWGINVPEYTPGIKKLEGVIVVDLYHVPLNKFKQSIHELMMEVYEGKGEKDISKRWVEKDKNDG